ncbi:(2Fe-2S)-binding protein [Arcobacter vandammei]|uniref:(2Fe-2S)-binding protein n=1 Tax=Arcobacter vandammei TaxID=2782243 RepID=UPI0018DF6D27|nr:(2Fe-2S)-binding protein [Arcobacter vandammei]
MARNFHHSYIVCECKQVSLGEIIFAIKEKGAKTLQDLATLTDAGSSCGCCRSAKDDIGEKKMELYLDEILRKFEKEEK